MTNIAICDDNSNDRKTLHTLLKKYALKHHLNFNIEMYDNGFIFLESVKKGYDICFLDIFMPVLSGIDTAKELRTIDKDTRLVFCSSSKDFALSGYSLQACNYLLKPLNHQKLYDALDEIFRKIRKETSENLCIPTNDGLKILTKNTICYVTPENNHCIIYLQNGTNIHCKLSFPKIVDQLSLNRNFSLISRSIILNFDYVVGLEKDKFILSHNVKISIPRRKKQQLTQEFLDYNMSF